MVTPDESINELAGRLTAPTPEQASRMDSIDLIREHLDRSRDLVLGRIEDMRDHALVRPTPNGGGHTLWVLGHLAYIEALVILRFMRGEPNPLAGWEPVFDGAEVSGDPAAFPAFDEVLATCRDQRAATRARIDELAESDLDQPAAACPQGFDADFGNVRRCLRFVGDHWLMHRGQLADARRAAGLPRMWL